jgi:XTP/dITP diphosphohydrolase
VEHTGLYLEYLNGFPGGLTQIFWDRVQADKFAQLFGQIPQRNGVLAKTVVGFVDGKTVRFFEGEIHGIIASEPRGNRSFQWDCIFVPDGYAQTFAEMEKEKDDISMRRKALDSFCQFLAAEGLCKS